MEPVDAEELPIQEVDGDGGATLRNDHDDEGDFLSDAITYNTSSASSHTYLGEVDDTHGRRAFIEGGAILKLPLFCLRGVVLFPEATLPLRMIQPRDIAAVECALNQVDVPYTIGVVCIYQHPNDEGFHISSVGTTAEIRQYRRLDDGSVNVVTRGRQRFVLRRHWIDVDGVSGEIQIFQEEEPTRTPNDAFAQLVSVKNYSLSGHRNPVTVPAKQSHYRGGADCSEHISPSSDRMGMCLAVFPSGSSSSSCSNKHDTAGIHQNDDGSKCQILFKRQNHMSAEEQDDNDGRVRKWTIKNSMKAFEAPLSFWPRWTYEMYDSYLLARKAADLWQQVIAKPSMNDYVAKPDVLSFYIGSKLPVSEFTRQELLEIVGVSYRLQREIQLLKAFNLIRCKCCMALIARRTDMVVMSSDGPLNAFVNEYGHVHEILTVLNANRLALDGLPTEENSWFPGYAWTVANCAICWDHIGWQFTAVRRKLLPRTFWGIRSSQISDDTLN